MGAPPGSNAPPAAGGGGTAGESLVYYELFFPQSTTGTSWAEKAVVYSADNSAPRPLLVVFHQFGVSHFDGFLNTEFFQRARKRGWHCVSVLGGVDVHFGNVESQQNTDVVMDFVLQNFNVDPERIYGVGFSMGGGAALNYAARRLDPAKFMFAAVVDHTGGVALKDTYANETGPGWPFAQFVLDTLFGLGTKGSADPWKLARSSVINFNPDTLVVETNEDLARNLTHVPIKITRATNEPAPTMYLATQTDVFTTHMQSLGGTISVDIVPYTGHSWDMLDEHLAMKWLGKQALRIPANGDVLADGDFTYFHFTVTQETANAFTPFHWSVNLTQNKVLLSRTENLTKMDIDLASTGLSTATPLLVVLDTKDGVADDALLVGWPTTPTQVLRDSVPQVGTWTYTALSQELLIQEFDGGTHVWQIDP
jgi:acetyl esterase/lipase